MVYLSGLFFEKYLYGRIWVKYPLSSFYQQYRDKPVYPARQSLLNKHESIFDIINSTSDPFFICLPREKGRNWFYDCSRFRDFGPELSTNGHIIKRYQRHHSAN